MGNLFGSSKSSNTTNQTTLNTFDKRIVGDNGAQALSGDNATLNNINNSRSSAYWSDNSQVTITDAGATKNALDSMVMNNAVNAGVMDTMLKTNGTVANKSMDVAAFTVNKMGDGAAFAVNKMGDVAYGLTGMATDAAKESAKASAAASSAALSSALGANKSAVDAALSSNRNTMDAAFGFAAGASKQSASALEKSIGIAETVLEKAFQTVKTGAEMVTGAQKGVESAYDNARSQTQDNRYLVAAGLAVVGIVGVMAFMGRK